MIALLDPELTLSLPPEPTATTGLDALCHAIESYTSINASPMSELISLEAIRLISDHLRTCVHNGVKSGRAGADAARQSVCRVGAGKCRCYGRHSLSYPLGGKYGVPHGLANTLLLPHVMAFNLPGNLEKFAIIAEIMGEDADELPLREAAWHAVEAVEALIEDCGVYTTLEDLDIPKEAFQDMAKMAMTVARPLENNPRKMTMEDAVQIYEEAY
jgi:alcohol dehydrogenase class IV